jgi:hypothetical protein
MPIAIALRPNLQQGIERIAPFDTGAFFRKMYSDHMHPKMQCKDFLMTPDLSTPGRVVSRFFGTNYNYYFGIPTKIAIPPLEFEAFSFQELIHNKSSTYYDDRRNSIELQSKEVLSLDTNDVLLVVLPGVFLSEQTVQAAVTNKCEAEIRTYTMHHGNPREYVSEIYKIVGDYLTTNLYIEAEVIS